MRMKDSAADAAAVHWHLHDVRMHICSRILCSQCRKTMQAFGIVVWWCLFAFVHVTQGARPAYPLSGGGNQGNVNSVGSPCPSVFRYEWDGAEWYGVIAAPSLPYGTPARLVARLSLGRVLPSKYAGSLELIGPRADILNAMLTEQPIRYRVNFPLSYPLPLVTAITLNDRLICSGPIVSGPIVTSITLEHTLYPHGLDLNSRDRQSPPQSQPVLPEQFPTRGTEVIVDQQDPIETNNNFAPNMDDKRIDFGFNPNDNTNNRNINTDNLERETSGPSTSVHNIIAKGVYEDTCGVPVTVRALVANGEVTQRGSHPWLVAIFAQKPLGFEFTCGGTLLNARFVVTAAHCIRYSSNRALTADELVVILGKYRIRRWTEKGSVVRDAARVIMHPDYRALSGDADVAVIELSEPVQFSDTIRPVCAWTPAEIKNPEGQQATIVGWGKDETGDKITPEPRQTKVKIVSQEDCLRSRIEFRYITSNRTLCAGGVEKGSGPCTGDSGGGLYMQRGDGRWYLRGVISMSLADPATKSCDLEHYSVFVDIAKFNNWLVQFFN